MTTIALLALSVLGADAGAGPRPTPTPFACPPVPVSYERSGEVEPPKELTHPTKVKHVPPVYPANARTKRTAARIVLSGTVTVEGTMRDVKVVESVDADFDKAAVDAVKQWEFKPATFRGAPCEVPYRTTINFAASTEPDVRPEP